MTPQGRIDSLHYKRNESGDLVAATVLVSVELLPAQLELLRDAEVAHLREKRIDVVFPGREE